jgi:viologen exporter family transport system permease protein
MNALSVYGRLISVAMRAQMQYRVSFVLLTIGQFLTSATEMVGIWALFQRFGSLTPWTLPQVALFYGVVNTAFAVTDAAARGFDLFGTQFVKTGNFDRLLLRPRSTVLQLAGHDFPLMRLGRMLQGMLVLGWAMLHVEVDWDAARLALLVVTLVATAVFFYGLVICTAVLSFWTTESLEIMNTLTYGGVETAQYPMAIYQKYFRRFFTFVVPLACVTYFPLVAVLGIDDPLGSGRTFQMLAPSAGVVFFALTLVLWRVGVRHYTSTGS